MFKLKNPRAPTWRHALPSYLRRNITSFGMAGSTRKVGGCSKIAAAAQPALLALVLFLPASNAAFCTEGTYFPISNRGRCDASFYHPSDDDVGDPVCVTCPDDTYMNEKNIVTSNASKRKTNNALLVSTLTQPARPAKALWRTTGPVHQKQPLAMMERTWTSPVQALPRTTGFAN